MCWLFGILLHSALCQSILYASYVVITTFPRLLLLLFLVVVVDGWWCRVRSRTYDIYVRREAEQGSDVQVNIVHLSHLCACACVTACVERPESAVDVDVQGRRQPVSQVRHVGAAERSSSGGTAHPQTVSGVDGVFRRRAWRRTAGACQTGA